MSKRLIVLAELAELDRFHSATDNNDGWWRAYHVRYFRTESPLREAGISRDATVGHLRALANEGLCDRRMDGTHPYYRINAAGRAALDGRIVAVELEVVRRLERRGRCLKIYGTVIDENRDERGHYAIIEEGEST